MVGETISHYRILEKLGGGGMGVIYRAEDINLGRQVALKFLPPELSKNQTAVERFQREARAASALNHPNICIVHDLGEHEGRQFIVMELLQGLTLKERMRQPLPSKEILRLTAQVAEALEAAHAQGVVHRDIKPENIVVTERGDAKILDFGIAKLAEPEAKKREPESEASPRLTETGAALGTHGYMSPEQALGLTLDARADVYSLGVVLYEMATGRSAMFEELMQMDLSSNVQLRSGLPAALAGIIQKALEREPRLRYQTMSDLRADLERLRRDTATEFHPIGRPPSRGALQKLRARSPVFLASLSLLVLLAGVGLGFGGRWLLVHRSSQGPHKIESVAVLPLKNLSGDPKEDYFAEGMTEALITDLSKIGALRVISRTSAMHYKDVDKPLKEIAAELRVDAVVEGSVLRAGDRVRITAQLVDASTDQHLWAESYERDVSDVLALQSEVARAIADQIKITITPQEQALLARTPTVKPAAHEAYLRGRYHWNRFSEDELRKSVEYYQQAIREDPGYALAYAGLADSLAVLGWFGAEPPEKIFPQAIEAANHALRLDETLGEAYTSLGYIHAIYDWNLPEAERMFQRALELRPGDALTHQWYADYLMFSAGRPEQALAEIQRARELDPVSLIANATVAWFLYLARRPDEAIAQAQKTVELDPNFALGHNNLALGYLEKRMYPEAIAEFQKAVQLAPQAPLFAAGLGAAYGAAGRKEEARKILLELKGRDGGERVPPYFLAWVAASIGDKDGAIQWLEAAYQQKASLLVALRVEPFFDPLRSDPRFEDLLRRIPLPAAAERAAQ